MDTITTAATTYTPPGTSVVHNAQVSLTDRSPASVVHVVQYDNTLPIVAVALTANGQPYTVPAGAAVNVRLAKPDGTYVYNPALGVSEDAQTAYIGTTVQMTTAWGQMRAIVEVVLNGAVAGTGTFVLEVTKNPVPEAAIESTSEFLTIQQLYQQIQQAATLLEEQSQNLQNVTDNLAAIQGAASNAQAAAQSAAEAAQSAQQALGFRTFFSAVSPDENGDLDPSRPMTTAAAQASWTVKSKGDRIQNVQVNGTSPAVGSNFVAVQLTSTLDWSVWTGTNLYFEAKLGTILPLNASNPLALSGQQYCTVATIGNADAYATGNYFWVRTHGSNARIRLRYGSIKTVDDLKKFLDTNNVFVWYVPENEEEATGIYIPIIARGHEYRCQCLPITEVLGVGDSVQSNVPSGCDKKIVFDASNLQGWIQDGTDDPEKYRYIYKLPDALSADASEEHKRNAYSDAFKVLAEGRTYYLEKGFTINADLKNLYLYDEGEPLSEWKEKVSSNPITLFYKSVDYARNSLPVSLETHASGAVYAHQAVELAAVPYTEADVAAANQLANTPSTLPNIDSPDVPMLLNESGATQTTESVAPLASALPVAGTYVVSSQYGTTVQVSLKAMQDGGNAATLQGMTPSDLREGGNAATLQGMTPSDLREGGNAATLQGKTLSDICDLLIPVGFIFEWAPVDRGPDLSTPGKVAAYFGFGTWAAFASGKVMAGVNSSHGIGTSVGAETHAITVDEMPSHAHNYNGWAVAFQSGTGSEMYALAKPYDQHNNFGMNTKSAGGGAAMSLMQPTTYVYIWQRIS